MANSKSSCYNETIRTMKPTLRHLLFCQCLALLSCLSLPHEAAELTDAELAQRARSVLAQTTGRISVPGLRQPVTVLRDPWGIPHIYAETQDDLFFAQGFVVAQDRLWQLDLWRRIGEGKVAEIAGPNALDRDRFARLVRYRGGLKKEFESYAPDARQIIEAFVRGINFFIESSRDRLPIEFQLTGTQPELWTPEVCLTRMSGYIMTRNAGTEILRAQLVRELGTTFVDDLFETVPRRLLEVPRGLDLAGIDNKILAGARAAGGQVAFVEREGSNNWVVDGQLSRTGKPLLANDPHRNISLPSLRYLVHLVGPGWNVIGAGEPAIPGVASGHNEQIGWGITIVGIDQQDLYVEETNPANPNQYRRRGRWEAMRIERERIGVKDAAEPAEVELKFTEHGPVIYEDAARHRAYALRWVGSEPGTAGYLACLSVDRARNWREFRRALERWKVPGLNFVYADVEGNIGWQVAGLTPVRRGWPGLLPVPGAEGHYEWQGFRSLAELPQSFNPSQHYLATANHNILPRDYRRELGYEWAAPYRFSRIAEVLGSSASSKFDIAAFQRLQHDEMSLPARELTQLLKTKTAPAVELRPYVEMVTNWDCVLAKDSAPAALFEVWVTKLRPAIFRPHLPTNLWPLVAGNISLVKTIEVLKHPGSRWFGPNAEAKRDSLLLQTFGDAVAETKTKLGANAANWRWGSLHVVSFKHPLSTSDKRRAVLDPPSVERGGDGFTVNATGGTGLTQTAGASFREIFDLADWDRSVATTAPGQSGQPQSPHYADHLPLWGEGRYFPLLFSRSSIESVTTNKLTLVPSSR